jgi:hypothetical protein
MEGVQATPKHVPPYRSGRCPYFRARCSFVREALSYDCACIGDRGGVVCGVLFQRCPPPTLAVSTLRRVVLWNLVVQQEFSCPTMRALRSAEISRIANPFAVGEISPLHSSAGAARWIGRTGIRNVKIAPSGRPHTPSPRLC